MFEIDNLRGPIGIQVIKDMMKLYGQEREVEFRPGLELDKCHCYSDNEVKMDDCHERKQSPEKTALDPYDWKHIYDCFQAAQQKDHGFADLCFLCNEWVFDEVEWGAHCQGHVDRLEEFPMFLDFLVFHGVLVMPGFSYDCLTNSSLPASKRMYQFKNKTKWQSHIQKHVDALEDCKPVKCGLRTKQCANTFNSILDFQFHLQDAYGINTLKRPKNRKRSSNPDAEGHPIQRKRTQLTLQKRKKVKCENAKDQTLLMEFKFVNTTFAAMEATVASSSPSTLSSRRSSPSDSATTSSPGSRDSRTETPPSSICDETPIDPGWSPDKTAPASDDDFVMIDTLEDGSSHLLDHVSSDLKGLFPQFRACCILILV